MADYYCHVAVAFKATEREAAFAADLARALDLLEDIEQEVADSSELSELPSETVQLAQHLYPDAMGGPGCEFNFDQGVVWIEGKDYPNIHALLLVLKEILFKFDKHGAIVVHWATTCSKARPDAAEGSGAAVVTPNAIRWTNVALWTAEKLEELKLPSLNAN